MTSQPTSASGRARPTPEAEGRSRSPDSWVIRKPELLERLAVSADWWARNWRRLVADHGFPPPIAGLPPGSFPRAAVELWVDRRPPAASTAAAPPDAPRNDLAARLRRRAEAVAGGLAANGGGRA